LADSISIVVAFFAYLAGVVKLQGTGAGQSKVGQAGQTTCPSVGQAGQTACPSVGWERPALNPLRHAASKSSSVIAFIGTSLKEFPYSPMITGNPWKPRSLTTS